MRIVHVIDYYQEQLGYQESHLAKQHAECGHDVFVVTSNLFYPFNDYETLYEQVLGNRKVLAGNSKVDGYSIIRNSILFEIKNRAWIKKLIKTISNLKPDVIICHGIVNFSFFRILLSTTGLLRNIRIIVDDHMAEDFISNKFVAKAFYGFFRIFFSPIVVRRSDKIVAVSEVTRKFMEINYGLPSQIINYIPLGADLSVYYPSDSVRLSMRNKFGINNSDIVLVYSGKIIPEKRIEFVIEAISQLPERNRIHFHFFLIGTYTSDYLKKLKSLSNYGINLYIQSFQKDPEQLADYYRMSDIGVWPFGASAGTIDCLACGNIIVCSDYLPERVSNNNGILISASDSADKLRDFLIEIFSDRKKLSSMKQNSFLLAQKEFSWRVISQNILK